MKKYMTFLLTLMLLVGLSLAPVQAEELAEDLINVPNGIANPEELLRGVDPGDDTPSCSGSFSSPNGDAYTSMQVGAIDSTYRTLIWGLWIKPSAQSKYGSEVETRLLNASVNGSDINPPYAPHKEEPDYNFHGSLKNYNFKGKSGGGSLKKNDIVYFQWSLVSTKTHEGTGIRLKCRI